jgi:hypothetical protein
VYFPFFDPRNLYFCELTQDFKQSLGTDSSEELLARDCFKCVEADKHFDTLWMIDKPAKIYRVFTLRFPKDGPPLPSTVEIRVYEKAKWDAEDALKTKVVTKTRFTWTKFRDDSFVPATMEMNFFGKKLPDEVVAMKFSWLLGNAVPDYCIENPDENQWPFRELVFEDKPSFK